MSASLPLFLLCVLGTVTAPSAASFDEPVGTLTLRQATTAALEGNPRLAAFSWEIRALEAEVHQAGRRANPELSLEIEDVRWTGGPEQTSVRSLEREVESGSHSGFAESEWTVSLSQVVELGGKRAKRIALAARQKDIAQWDYEALRADVLAETARAFIAVLVAQERVALAQERAALAEEVAQSIALRVEAGRVSPIEGDRAQIEVATARTGLERSHHELAAARSTLAAAWGSRAARFDRAVGEVDAIQPVAEAETLADAFENNPDLARWTAELAAREALVELEDARRIPDPTLTLGFRSTGLGDRAVRQYGTDGLSGIPTRVDYDDSRDNSLVLGFSLPLPLFDRNRGNIEAARHRATRAEGERRATENALWTALSQAREQAAAAYAEATTLRSDVLDAANTTFDKTRIGYEQGKFNYLEVLEAQRTLVETKTAHLDALERYHDARIALERLTGAPPDAWTTEIEDNE